MSNNQQTLDTYNKSVTTYIATSPQKVDGQLKKWLDEALADLPKDVDILEIGSGSGKDADYIEAQGYSVELTDASQGFVDYLNKKGKQARLLNALTDDFGKNRDMILADAVFLHFDEVELSQVLAKALVALKPGGQLVFSLKVGEGDEVTSRKLNSERYFRFWQQPAINSLLKKAGFNKVDVTTVDDYRGKERPDWLLLVAKKAAA